MHIRRLLAVSFLSLLAVAVYGGASPTTIVVDGGSAEWAFVPETGTPSAYFTVGPDAPPSGTGSALLLTDDSADGVAIFSQELISTGLDEFTTLSYWTYTDSSPQAPALQFSIDYDDTDSDVSWQGRLVYEPSNNGTPTNDTWEQWNTLTGSWWATGAPGNVSCGQATPCTWATILAMFPDAAIQGPTLGQFLVKSGSGWSGTNTTYTDAIEVVTSGGVNVLYDFEPTTNQINTAQLSENGWFSDDTRADGTSTMPEAVDTNLVSPTLTDDPEGSSGAATADHDDDIQNQIYFTLFGPPVEPPVNEWQGAVHLQIETGVNEGKSQISHRNNPDVTADPDGFGLGNEILNAAFLAKYSWMGDGMSTVTASLKLGFMTPEYPGADMSDRTGEDAWDKLLIYEPGNGNGGMSNNLWHTESINFNTGLWWIVDRGPNAGNTIGDPMTLLEMASSGVMIGGRTVAALFAVLANPTPGQEAILTSIQFGIGSFNAGGSVYVNQLETSFYRKGMITTFGTDPVESAVICVPSSFDAACEAVAATIQDAIDTENLGAEDIIMVDAGTYNESPIVDESVMLMGANAGTSGCGRSATETIITGNMRIGASDVVVDGFSFENAGEKVRLIGPSDRLTFRNNRFIDGFTQITSSLDSDDVTIDDNEFVGNNVTRSVISGLIRLFGAYNGLYVRRNCFRDHTDNAMAFDGATVAASGTRSPVFADNTFTNLAGGLDFSYGTATGAEFSGNQFVTLTGPGIQGQLVDSLIVDNLFSGGTGDGLVLSEDMGGVSPSNASTGNSALLNCFYQNQGTGIAFSDTTNISSNSARFNDMVGNTTGASYAGTETVDVTNNFWGTSDGPSGDGPGSGDPVSGTGLDFTPFATNPFTFSTPCAPVADLSITKVDNVADAQAVVGQTVVYTITVDNLGPFDSTGAQVFDPIPAGLSTCTWTCSSSGGASCGAASGEDSINETVDIPVGDSVTYELTCNFDPDPDGVPVDNVALVIAGDQTDSNPDNDSDTERTATEDIFTDGFESGDTTAWSSTVN